MVASVSAALVMFPATLPEDEDPEDALPDDEDALPDDEDALPDDEDAVLEVDEDPDADAVEEVDDAVVSPALSVDVWMRFRKRLRKRPRRIVQSGVAT